MSNAIAIAVFALCAGGFGWLIGATDTKGRCAKSMEAVGFDRGLKAGEVVGSARYVGRKVADQVVGAGVKPDAAWAVVFRDCTGDPEEEPGAPEQLDAEQARRWRAEFHRAADERWKEIRGARATAEGEAN